MLLKFEKAVKGTIIRRPSKFVKSPYVADVLLQNGKEILAHCPSLGCCGLCEKDSKIFVSPIASYNNQKGKCSHRAIMSLLQDKKGKQLVGINPGLAENMIEQCLHQNLIGRLKNYKQLNKQYSLKIGTKVNSRFDFHGKDQKDQQFILQVKSVPLADYEDLLPEEKQKMDFSKRKFKQKIAYFPDGYRKKPTDPVSPRAIKHLEQLIYLYKEYKIRTMLCFVIQRSDVNRFQASVMDPHYRACFFKAIQAGVEIFAVVVEWNEKGQVRFIRDDLPLIIQPSIQQKIQIQSKSTAKTSTKAKSKQK